MFLFLSKLFREYHLCVSLFTLIIITLFIELLTSRLCPLQLVQNYTSSFLCCRSKFIHFALMARDHHYLPIKFCTLFKIFFIIYRNFNTSFRPTFSPESHTQPILSFFSALIPLLIPRPYFPCIGNRATSIIAPNPFRINWLLTSSSFLLSFLKNLFLYNSFCFTYKNLCMPFTSFI